MKFVLNNNNGTKPPFKGYGIVQTNPFGLLCLSFREIAGFFYEFPRRRFRFRVRVIATALLLASDAVEELLHVAAVQLHDGLVSSRTMSVVVSIFERLQPHLFPHAAPLPVQPTAPHHRLDPALTEHPLPEVDALLVRVEYQALQREAAPLEAGLKRKHSEQLWKAVNDPFASNAHFFKKGNSCIEA